VALLDCDDRWLPDYLETHIEGLRATGADIAYSTVVMIEDQTDHVLGTWGPTPQDVANFPESLLGSNFITPSATVLRRSVLGDVGPWNSALRYAEDYDYFLRSIAAGKRFHYVGGCRCWYRKNHAGAATARLCEALDTVADVSRRFMAMPVWSSRKAARKRTAGAYARAARMHWKADRSRDSSANPGRTCPMMLKACLLYPRASYLYKAAISSVAALVPRRRAATPAVPAAPLAARGPAVCKAA
jgi:GT2 family glycosyltransferase